MLKKRHFLSFYLNCKFKTLRYRQVCIHRGGSIIVGRNAQLNLNDAYLFVNKSHFPKNYKPLSGSLWIEENGILNFGKDHFTLCEGSKIHVRPNALLHIEGKSFINTGTEIDVYESIFIGHGTIISSNCYITDSDQHKILSEGVITNKNRPIHIGKNVWIGRNVTILKGVTIGDNSVIAAGSVVTKSVEPNSLYGGNPSKKLKENIDWKF